MRRIRVRLEGVKSITIEYLTDDPASEDAVNVDADTELATGDPVGFGFTPFSTNDPWPDEE